MKILIDSCKRFSKFSRFNALSKARQDVSQTLINLGFQNLKIHSFFGNFIANLQILFKIKSGNEYIIQYPIEEFDMTFLAKRIKKRGSKLTYIVHDLELIRFDAGLRDEEEIQHLQYADCLIVHTPKMKEFLEKIGCRAEIKVMYLFDYYSQSQMLELDKMLKMKNVVAFAGNLRKSEFVESLSNLAYTSLKIRLYGKKHSRSKLSKAFVDYCGSFRPENPSVLKAAWGLVWDGDSLDTCAGQLGEYLMYNSAHKISLYLSCGMPVILWSKSSIADYLCEKGVAITINSLWELEVKINAITDEQYKEMALSAQKIAKDLRFGNYLKKCVK